MKKFKKATINGHKNKSNLKQMEQKDETMKSFCPNLSELEFLIYMNIINIYMKEQEFTMSNLQIAGHTGASESEVGNAVNHLIELTYFKIVPSAKNFSYLRYLKPYEAHFDVMMKLYNYGKANPEILKELD